MDNPSKASRKPAIAPAPKRPAMRININIIYMERVVKGEYLSWRLFLDSSAVVLVSVSSPPLQLCDAVSMVSYVLVIYASHPMKVDEEVVTSTPLLVHIEEVRIDLHHVEEHKGS